MDLSAGDPVYRGVSRYNREDAGEEIVSKKKVQAKEKIDQFGAPSLLSNGSVGSYEAQHQRDIQSNGLRERGKGY